VVKGQRHVPAALYFLERPGTHCTGGWVEYSSTGNKFKMLITAWKYHGVRNFCHTC